MRAIYISAYTSITVLLCLALAQSATAQTVFSGTSWSDFPGGAKAACANELNDSTADDDIDEDNDGLIEMCYLEDVDAMRHSLSGTSLRINGTNLTAGCKSGGCNGYELVRDLDFNDDDSYRDVATNKEKWTISSSVGGWSAIGVSRTTFTAALEGNGHTISNLFISTTDAHQGLLGYNDGDIQNLGLSNVNINTNPNSTNAEVAVLVAREHHGRIANCYIQGTLIVRGGRKVATLATGNKGTIFNSYVDITASGLFGAFVNGNSGGNIVNSYIVGDVGGVGFTKASNGSITNVYFAANSNSQSNTQSVFESKLSDGGAGTITNSYWDTDKWQGREVGADHSIGTNLRGFSTMGLQTPTTSGTVTTDPYYKWSTDNWDFGTNKEYPAVKYAAGNDSSNPACRNEQSPPSSQQPLCGTLLPGQRNNQPRITMPANNTRIAVTPGTEHTIDVTVIDKDIKDQLTLLLRALDPNQDLVEFAATTATVMPNAGNPQRAQQQFTITIPTAITTLMTTLQLVAEDDSGFDNAQSEPVSLIVAVEGNIAPTIVIPTIPSDIKLLQDTSTTLNVIVADTNNDPLNVSVRSSNDKVATATITPSGASRILTVTAVGESTATITVMVDDGRGEANSIASVSFTIEVEASAAPMPSVSPKSQIMQLNSTANITVSVSDDNYDLDDMVDITVRSSDRNIVSVNRQRIEDIADNNNRLLILTGVALGNATVTITATDSQSYSNSTTMTVHVNAPPMITSYDSELRIQGGSTTMTTVSVSDADISDVLTLELRATDPSQDIVALPAPITIMPNNLEARPTRTLTIRGLKGGRIPLTLIVSDGSVTAEVRVTVIVEAPPQAPMIESVSISDRLQHRTNFFYSDAIRVQVSDANYATGDVVTVTARSSNGGILQVSGQGRTDINNRTAEIGAVRVAVGDVIITITAKDSTGQTDTLRKLVRFQGHPSIVSNHPQVRITADVEHDINVTVSDPNFDEVLTLTLSAVDTSQDIVEIITTSADVSTNNMVTRASEPMTVKGLKVGNTTLTLVVMDESGRSSAQQQMIVTVEPNTKPTIALDPPTSVIGLVGDTSTMLNVEVGNDDNVSEDAADFMVSASSSDPTVAVARLDASSGKTTYGLTVEAQDIATVDSAVITVTVDDGRTGEANSTASVSFTVGVEPNEAPILTISPSDTEQTLQLDSMASIIVSAADANYDIGDMVAITVVVSGDTDVLSVTSEAIPKRTSTATATITLSADKAGDATLTITATDNQDAKDSAKIAIRVNAPPTILSTSKTPPKIKIKEKQTIRVNVSDANTTDTLTLSLTAVDTNQDIVSLPTDVEIPNNGEERRDARELTIQGLNAGETTLTLVVSDGKGGVVEATIMAKVEANAAPTISGLPEDAVGLLVGADESWSVTVADADDDDIADELMVSVSSSDPTVATAILDANSGKTTYELTVDGVGEGKTNIAMSASDGKTTTTKVFKVAVETNVAPQPTIIPSTPQILQKGSTTTVMVSVLDTNYDVGDMVDVVVVSDDTDVVSVDPMVIPDITTDTAKPITLTAHSGGDALITITATDDQMQSNSVPLKVHVNAAPTITVSDAALSVKAGRETTLDVEVADVNREDVLTLTLQTNPPNVVSIATPSDVTTNNMVVRAKQTLTIKGLERGTTELTLMVSDGSADTQTTKMIMVEANAAPMLPSFADLMLQVGATDSLDVLVADADDDDDADGFTVTAQSSTATVATVSIQKSTVAATHSLVVAGVGVGHTQIEVRTDDGRGVSNSRVLKTFTVTVEASAAPMLTIVPPDEMQILQLNSVASIIVSAADANYGVGDVVAISAVVSGDTDVVSVTSEAIADRTSTETATITLSADKAGDAVLTITAEDSIGLSDEVILDLHVNAPPMISDYEAAVTAIIGREKTITVSVSDENVNDELKLILREATEQTMVELVTTSTDVSGGVGTLTIKGLERGTTTLTLVVSDGIVERQVPIDVLVRANAAPTITASPLLEDRDVLRETTTTTIRIEVDDVDEDDPPSELMVTATSSKPEVVAAILETTSTGIYSLILVSKMQLSSATITVTVDDGNGEDSSVTTESFDVNVVTRPVVVGNPPTTVIVRIGDTFELTLSEYFDADDKTALRYSASGLPSNNRFNFDTTSTMLTIIPTSGDESTDPTGHTVVVSAKDNHGTAELTLTLLIDAEPTGGVTIAADNDNQWLLRASSTVVDANNGGNEPTPRYQWYRDNTKVDTNSDSYAYAIADTADGRAAGTEYRVEVTYTDNIGQVSVIPSNVYAVANVAPTITTTAATDIALSEGASTTVDVEVADENLDTLSLSLTTDDAMIATATIVATDDATHTIRIVGTGSGTAKITASVEDSKGGEANIVFTVNVAINLAPMLVLTPATDQILQLGSTTSLVIAITDANFGENDVVKLAVASSTPTVATIAPTETKPITENTTKIFTLSTLAAGDTRITVTATDSKDGLASEEITVHVNAPPRIAIDRQTPLSIQVGRLGTIAVMVADANSEDVLTLALNAEDAEQTVVSIETTSVRVEASEEARASQELTVTGLEVGTTTLGLVVSDGSADAVHALIPITVSANTAPTIPPLPDIQLLQGGSTTLTITITDADADDPSDEFSVSVMSDNEDAAKVTKMQTDDTTYSLVIEGVAEGTADIKVVADDGRGADNSNTSRTFTVAVAANEAPTITISPTDNQILQLDDTLELSVSVEDANYIAGDAVTITVATTPSSMLAIVPDKIAEVTTSDTQTIMLTAIAGGDTVITITATDRGSASTSTKLAIRVEAPPTIATIDTITANEGDTVTIDPEVNDANNDDLIYQWRVVSGDNTASILQGVTTNTKALSFTIPPDYIANTSDDNATHGLILELKVTEAKDSNPASTTQTVVATITKINNGKAIIETIIADRDDNRNLMFPEIKKSSDSDGEISGAITYQWQICIASSTDCATDWGDIPDAIATTFIVRDDDTVGDRFRVAVTYSDGQGYTDTLYSPEHTHTTGIRIRTKVYLEGPLR